MEEKKYTKTKMFLYLLFILIAVVFITQLVAFLQDFYSVISLKNSELKCADVKYDVRVVSYKEGRLLFELMNNDYDVNITGIRVMPDIDEEYMTSFDPWIRGGSNKVVEIRNISISKGFHLAIQECPERRYFVI